MKNKGQTLVEMIVVIGVVVVLATGIIAGTSISLSRGQGSQNRAMATTYAQEGIELARQLRDEGWTAFAAMGTAPTVYCVGADGAFLQASPSCTPNISNLFTRSVTLALSGPDMSVDVLVTWGANASGKVELKTTLTHWR